MCVSCKVCTCLISISMKNINLVGDSCMYMSMQRWDASVFLSKRVSPGRLSCQYPKFAGVALGLPSTYRKEGPASRQNLSPNATTTTPTEATFESKRGGST